MPGKDKSEPKKYQRRVLLRYSSEEWQAISTGAKQAGFKSVAAYVNHRVRKYVKNLKGTTPPSEKKICLTFYLQECDNQIVDAYCIQNSINKSLLIRRLSTEPLLLQQILSQGQGGPPAPPGLPAPPSF